jgi:hypothetical protein
VCARLFLPGPAVFYIGIIDILQKYDYTKKIERWYKTTLRGQSKDGISAMPSDMYRQRFLNKLRDIIEPVGPEWHESQTSNPALAVRESPRSFPSVPTPVFNNRSEEKATRLSAGGTTRDTRGDIRDRRCSVRNVDVAGIPAAKSEAAFTWNFPPSWELYLWNFDEWGIKLLQQWPLAPKELWPSVQIGLPGMKGGSAVQVNHTKSL